MPSGITDVADHEIDTISILLPNRQRFFACSGFKHLIAELRKYRTRQLAQAQLIFDDEHGFIASLNLVRGAFLGNSGGLGLNQRQINSKRRAVPGLTVHVDPALMLLYDTEYRGQAQAAALSRFFRREEGLENPGNDLGEKFRFRCR